MKNFKFKAWAIITALSVAASTASAADSSATTYLTFSNFCDEIQLQQTPGTPGVFYGVNSPSSCEQNALIFAYVIVGSDGQLHVTLSGGYADQAGTVSALKGIDLLLKPDANTIGGSFSAYGVTRSTTDRSATQMTNASGSPLSGTWLLGPASKGTRTFAPRSAGQKQPSLFSGL